MIVAKTSKRFCKLKLPANLSQLHLVFHVLQLKPFIENRLAGRRQPPPPHVKIKDILEWEVENLVES